MKNSKLDRNGMTFRMGAGVSWKRGNEARPGVVLSVSDEGSVVKVTRACDGGVVTFTLYPDGRFTMRGLPVGGAAAESGRLEGGFVSLPI